MRSNVLGEGPSSEEIETLRSIQLTGSFWESVYTRLDRSQFAKSVHTRLVRCQTRLDRSQTRLDRSQTRLDHIQTGFDLDQL